MILLEYILPSMLILVRWDAFGLNEVVRVLAIGVLVFGVVVSVWCTVANILFISG